MLIQAGYYGGEGVNDVKKMGEKIGKKSAEKTAKKIVRK